jgi:hypothetical protein
MRNKQGSVTAFGLFAVLVLIAGAVGWFVLYQNEFVTIEGRIREPGLSGDVVTSDFDVRVTNHHDQPLNIQYFGVVVWADEGRTVELSRAEVSGLLVAPGAQATVTLPLEIRNAEAMGSDVWVDASAVWTYGEEVSRETVQAYKVDLGSALDKLLGGK